MFNARATFNALIREAIDPGIVLHLEENEATKWPSYRVHWLSCHPTSATGEMEALVQVDVSVGGSDTGTLWERATRLQTRLALANYGTRPRARKLDFTDPKNPRPTTLWMNYGLDSGRGWVKVPLPDPTKRRLALSLTVRFPIG